MAFKLGDFFPKQPINELLLELDDPKWNSLEGGYKGTLFNPTEMLRKLEGASSISVINDIYLVLWNELHHQGDVGLASYYSVPHLTRIAKEKQLFDYNALGLVSVIEIQRHKNNPKLPSALSPAYNQALLELGELATLSLALNHNLDLANTSSALTALAISKGQIKLANVILNLDSEDVIDEFLENYG